MKHEVVVHVLASLFLHFFGYNPLKDARSDSVESPGHSARGCLSILGRFCDDGAFSANGVRLTLTVWRAIAVPRVPTSPGGGGPG